MVYSLIGNKATRIRLEVGDELADKPFCTTL